MQAPPFALEGLNPPNHGPARHQTATVTYKLQAVGSGGLHRHSAMTSKDRRDSRVAQGMTQQLAQLTSVHTDPPHRLHRAPPVHDEVCTVATSDVTEKDRPCTAPPFCHAQSNQQQPGSMQYGTLHRQPAVLPHVSCHPWSLRYSMVWLSNYGTMGRAQPNSSSRGEGPG